MKIRTFFLYAIGMLTAAGAAQADPYDVDGMVCPTTSKFIQTSNVTGNTGGSDACFGAFDGKDPGPSGDGIETNGMIFDFIAKSDIGEGGSQTLEGADIGLKVTFGDSCDGPGADDNGCWSFTNLPSGYGSDFMIVIKAADSPGWAAYLFSDHNDSRSGTWLVAWRNKGACTSSVVPGTKACADISHLSIYAKRGGDMRVTEPGTLGLLGLGLVGLGLARRRRLRT